MAPRLRLIFVGALLAAHPAFLAHAADTVRLVGGAAPHEGRVEVMVEGAWRPVCFSCNDAVYGRQWNFDDAAAGIACRQLGYQSGPPAVHSPDSFGGPAAAGATVPTFSLTNHCDGAEATLANCSYSLSNTCIDYPAVTCPVEPGAPGAATGGLAPGGLLLRRQRQLGTDRHISILARAALQVGHRLHRQRGQPRRMPLHHHTRSLSRSRPRVHREARVAPLYLCRAAGRRQRAA
ncbi:hypothetical protein ABPG75_007034 [Micractinium tetrahymenae]